MGAVIGGLLKTKSFLTPYILFVAVDATEEASLETKGW